MKTLNVIETETGEIVSRIDVSKKTTDKSTNAKWDCCATWTLNGSMSSAQPLAMLPQMMERISDVNFSALVLNQNHPYKGNL